MKNPLEQRMPGDQKVLEKGRLPTPQTSYISYSLLIRAMERGGRVQFAGSSTGGKRAQKVKTPFPLKGGQKPEVC